MQNDNRIGEECGVFAIYDPDGDCARTTYYGLYALQHREIGRAHVWTPVT